MLLLNQLFEFTHFFLFGIHGYRGLEPVDIVSPFIDTGFRIVMEVSMESVKCFSFYWVGLTYMLCFYAVLRLGKCLCPLTQVRWGWGWMGVSVK